MSVSAKSYASSLAHTQPSSIETASRQQSSPNTSFSPSQPADANTTNPFPTPADSAYGLSTLADYRAEDNRANETAAESSRPAEVKDQMDVDTPPTDVKLATSESRSGIDSRAEVAPSTGLASDEITLEQIQRDMGEAFLLCRSKLHQSRPNPSEHLLSRYGLGPIVATVARADPKTGEKINKLRKSYEGQIKNFGLSGRNKPDKRDDKPLLAMMDWPEQEWEIQKVASKKIDFTDDFKSKLQKAMKMEPGSVRNQGEWDNIMGHERPLRPTMPSETKPDSFAASTPRTSINGTTSTQQKAQTSEINRPRRAGKKRSYNDESFAGYGEGYLDDEGDMEAYSSDEGGRGPGRKRRKREHQEG
ncbi:putative rox3 family protein [Phaeomoniella chlamydospora]|uniref:Mediator of RNA polymerase II transcription subunit 19 n=1 Tax=Phaeomoniella chlamydospora TaxID=158046 RepID=A0A0G2GK76_PHACM|nr:putative rox3 family protein [Phaeomoniella chlamydospora]